VKHGYLVASRRKLRLGFIPLCYELIPTGFEISRFCCGLVPLRHELALTGLQFGHLLLELALARPRGHGR